MTETASSSSATPQVGPTSLWARLTNTLVSPGYVFDEVINSPHRVWNWLVPVVLVSCTSLLLLKPATPVEQIPNAVRGLVGEEAISSTQADAISKVWTQTSVGAICCAAVFGTLWSAFVIWSMGRFLLKVRFSFSKAIEVVGLAQMILVLGAVVTLLLVAASGDAAARPALSFFASTLTASTPLRMVLDTFNVFHIWTTAVLALGLSRLSGVSFKEAGFWVFGYWVAARLALILLG